MIRVTALGKKLAIALLSLIFSLALVEQILRLLRYNVSPLQIESANPFDQRSRHIFDDKYFTYDPELMWRPRPNFGVFNSQGFRGAVLALPKPEGSIRIFTVGDSNTLGLNDKSKIKGANWPDFLQDLLRKQNDKITVINAAAYGYTSFQGELRLRECLQYKPDIVLISFGANDAHPVMTSDRDFAKSGVSHPGASRILRKYRLGRIAWMTWSRMFTPKTPDLKPRVSLQDYKEHLMRMVDLAEGSKARVFLLTRPYTGPVLDERYWKNYAQNYNRATVEVAINRNVPVIDLYTLFKLEDKYFGDESHFTPEGYRAAAQIIADFLHVSAPLR